MVKFVQVAANNSGIYGLDAEGTLWLYRNKHETKGKPFWHPFTDRDLADMVVEINKLPTAEERNEARIDCGIKPYEEQ